ncbi:hypothetical protein Ptr902_08133 [Pyrenophora tritici-repentis]|nr:hypothetical protein Ptr902_08133 [Pyrenophora tritici-repentis]
MPLDSNHTLHAWIKFYKYNHDTERMSTEPHKHDLLGFPGVEIDEPKKFIRRLWLVVNNDRISKPQFLDKHVDLAERVNSVVNTFLRKDEDKRYEELCGGAFLEKDAMHILNDKERLTAERAVWQCGGNEVTNVFLCVCV